MVLFMILQTLSIPLKLNASTFTGTVLHWMLAYLPGSAALQRHHILTIVYCYSYKVNIHDIVEAHCYFVDIRRIDREQIRSRINNMNSVLQFMFKRPTTASTGKAPQSKEEPKGSGWGELWKPSRSEKPPRTWTWTVASSYPWSGTPSSTHTPHPTLSLISL